MGFWSAKTAATPDPVGTARTSMRKLSERGVEIPTKISAPIIAAQTTNNLLQASPETQSHFWAAYGALNSKIKSPEEARGYYRRFFYGILTALLLLQLYFSSFVAVQKGLLEVNKSIEAAEVMPAGGAPAAVAGGAVQTAAQAAVQTKNSELAGKQATYLHVADYLMGFPRKVASFLGVIGLGTSEYKGEKDRPEVVAQVQLELATSFVGGFLLPVLYGMLGAIAFVLRRLSDETVAGEEASALKRKYSLRVPIGALSGLAAGWLLQPSTGSVTASLSPFALAFVAGYSADLVFAAMDRIVGAFTTPSPPPTPPPAPELPSAPLEAPVDDGTRTDEVQPNTASEAAPNTASGATADTAGEAPAPSPSVEAATPTSRAQANQDV
ncbi:hypothetical protein ABIB80_006866 [Bradyrhizobium sp. i1.15.2]|uniref:hypothetical protein n=1 Tax=Bradyrhizobium sp. i1.15.2 TaxID=3156362 RepID=UPI00339689B9